MDFSPAARPVLVTLRYNEAARMMDGGEQVDSVALPLPLQEMLMPYVEEHYKPEPKKKVRRNYLFAADEGRDPRPPRGDAGKARLTDDRPRTHAGTAVPEALVAAQARRFARVGNNRG